jgi:predicted nucleic acid-binding protein
VTETVAERWCRVDAIRAYPAVGWLIAATAYEHGLTLATRNWRDFDGLPVALVNLFELAAADLSEAASTM